MLLFLGADRRSVLPIVVDGSHPVYRRSVMDPFSHASKGHSGLRPQLLRRGLLVLCSSRYGVSGKGERESVGVIELKALMVNCHIYLYYGRFLTMKSPILERVRSTE